MSNHEVDLWALTDLCTPWCVHLAVTLRVAEQIADGYPEFDRLAERVSCDAHALGAVLRHLASKGLFVEAKPGRFELNEPARLLLDPGVRIGLDLDGIGGRMAHAWSTLIDFVKTGKPAYDNVFGLPFWEDLDAHPNLAKSFDALIGPTGHGTPDPEMLIDGDWSSVRTVVDVGGGTGALLAEILRAHPGINGILIDLPRTVARSGAIFEGAGVSGRVTVSGQSFFDPLPAGADLYILKSILNDWPDSESLAILKRCAEAARPDGRVVISGGVTADERLSGLTIEIVLLGGRTRPLSEFREFSRQAGLVVVGSGHLPSGRFVVECRPS